MRVVLGSIHSLLFTEDKQSTDKQSVLDTSSISVSGSLRCLGKLQSILFKWSSHYICFGLSYYSEKYHTHTHTHMHTHTINKYQSEYLMSFKVIEDSLLHVSIRDRD